jgi:general secretion pathway protein G
MKRFFKSRRDGFTLVELLIVTVIIGILAGMMMLTMGSATDGAEATRVINDLRLVKSAALMYYFDNEVWPAESNGGTTPVPGLEKSLEKYMDKTFSGSYQGKVYAVAAPDANNVTKVYYGLSPDKLGDGAKKKLKSNGSIYDVKGKPYNGSDSGPFFMVIR